MDQSKEEYNDTKNIDKLSIISPFNVIQNNFIKQTIDVLLFKFFYIFLEASILYSEESYNF